MEVRHVCLQDTIHGAFLDICVNSEDPEIFAASDYRVHQCMDIAKRMNAKAVVFHTNYIVNFRLRTYIDSWINRNEEYWRRIINEYKDQYIYIENMFDDAPFMLAELAKEWQTNHILASALILHMLLYQVHLWRTGIM